MTKWQEHGICIRDDKMNISGFKGFLTNEPQFFDLIFSCIIFYNIWKILSILILWDWSFKSYHLMLSIGGIGIGLAIFSISFCIPRIFYIILCIPCSITGIILQKGFIDDVSGNFYKLDMWSTETSLKLFGMAVILYFILFFSGNLSNKGITIDDEE